MKPSEAKSIGPDAIAIEVDAILARGRRAGEHGRIYRPSVLPHILDDMTEVAAIARDNYGHDEVESYGSGLLVFGAAIAKPAKAVILTITADKRAACETVLIIDKPATLSARPSPPSRWSNGARRIGS